MESPHVVPEVLFCDFCNASVPLQDVQAGTALQHAGKTIGACCLGVIRGPAAPAPRSAGEVRAGGEGRMLTLGIVVLVAVAAAALFLDYRIGQAEVRFAAANDTMGQALRSQGEVVQSISLALDTKAERGDAQNLATALAAVATGQTEAGKQLQALATGVASLGTAVRDVQGTMAAIEKARPDHGPVLAELQRQLQQQAVSLAEILARPRPAEASAPSRVDPAPEIPADGLPADVAHQVSRLADRDEGVRFEAVDDLLKRREPKVLPHLLPLVKDPDTFVRRLVAEGLKDYAKPEVVDSLLVALADPEEIVRDSAWRSLKELTKQNLPFEAAGTRDARARQQQKWQEWWDKNKAGFGS